MIEVLRARRSEVLPIAVLMLFAVACGAAQAQLGNNLLLSVLLLLFAAGAFYLLPDLLLPVLVVLVFVDFTVGDVAGIPDLLVREALMPLMLAMYLLRAWTHRQGRLGSITKSPIASLAVLFGGVIFLSYLRNPVLPANLLHVSTSNGGLRPYLDGLGEICAFLLAFWLVKDSLRNLRWLSGLVLVTGLTFVVIGLFDWLTGSLITVPFMPQDTQYWTGVDISNLYAGTALRIGQLQTFGPLVAIAALVSSPESAKGRLARYAVIFMGAGATFLSGGRTAFIGLLVAAFIFELIIARHRAWADLAVLAGLAALVSGSIQALLPGQVSRLMTVTQGLTYLDPGRSQVYGFYIDGFLRSPILGLGIGQTPGKVYSFDRSYGPFINLQLTQGGHGTYLSVLYTLGALGGLAFFGFLLALLLVNFRLVRSNTSAGIERYWSNFAFLFVLYTLPNYVVGGSGLNDPRLFVIAGIVAGLAQVQAKHRQAALKPATSNVQQGPGLDRRSLLTHA